MFMKKYIVIECLFIGSASNLVEFVVAEHFVREFIFSHGYQPPKCFLHIIR